MTPFIKLWPSDGKWADEIDFVGPRIRPALMAWLLLAAGLLACMAVLPMIEEAEAARQEAEASLKRLQRATHQYALKQKAAQSGSSAVAQEGLTAQGQQAATRLARRLAYPWLPTLDQVEAAAQARQVVLLTFSLDLADMGAAQNARPDVKLGAAVSDDEQALAWAQAHGAAFDDTGLAGSSGQAASPTQAASSMPSASAGRMQGRARLSTPIVTASGERAWRAEALWQGVSP